MLLLLRPEKVVAAAEEVKRELQHVRGRRRTSAAADSEAMEEEQDAVGSR